MKKQIALIGLSVLLSAMLLLPMCQGVTVGVSVGDWFKYEPTVVHYEAGPNVPFPPNEYATEPKEYNETDWYRYEVTAINGGNVTFEVTTHWSNGTETAAELVDDMENSFTMMIISTDLEPDDTIRPEYDWTPVFGFEFIWPERKLGETVMVEYQNVSREANALNFVHPVIFGDSYTEQIYYWDKATGIQVVYEVHSNSSDFNSGEPYSYIARRTLVDSSIEGMVIPEFYTLTTMLLLISATAIPIALSKRNKIRV